MKKQSKILEQSKQVEEYTFKDSVLKMYELMGLGSITMEYDELPGVEVTLSLEEKNNV